MILSFHYFFILGIFLNFILCSSLFFHFACLPPFFNHTVHFLSLPCFYSLSYYFSSLNTLKIIFLSIIIAYSFFLSYKGLIVFLPFQVSARLLLIVWLWLGNVFAGVVLFPGLFCFILAIPVQQHARCGGQYDSHSASWREELTKE